MAPPRNTRGRPPPSWNAYRPVYSPPPRDDPTSYRGERLKYDNSEVNQTPLGPYQRRTMPSPAGSPLGPRFTQDWDETLDFLMARTARAYDLVVAYKRDSEGGTRWTRDSIAYIHDMGKHLHEDIRDFRHCDTALQNGERGISLKEVIEKAEKLWDYCERIQELIKNTERVPLRQRMTRVPGIRHMTKEEEDRQTDIDARAILHQQAMSSRVPLGPSGTLVDDRASAEAEAQALIDQIKMGSPVDPIHRVSSADWATTSSTPKRFKW